MAWIDDQGEPIATSHIVFYVIVITFIVMRFIEKFTNIVITTYF